MRFSIIPFLLLVIPILEIAVFIAVGGQIGVIWTLAMILVTAIIGSILLRVQGFQVINQLREATEAGRVPGRELVHGAMILAAGILLLTPGFVTDTIGFLLFVPLVRDIIWKAVASKITIVTAGGAEGPFSRHGGQSGYSGDGYSGTGYPGDDVVDLDPDEFHETGNEEPGKPNPQSPWNTREKPEEETKSIPPKRS